MKIIRRIFWGMVFMSVISIHAQDAPISAIEILASMDNEVSISVTASSINDIGSCNLQLLYDPTVAICTAVTKGSFMPGTLATNIDVPGVVTLGWFTWPGATLPNNTVIFNLDFSKISSGTTTLVWNSDYNDRQWSNGNSIVLNDLPFGDFYLDGSLTFLENSPVTTAPVISSCSGLSVDVPITVAAFNNIGAISLTLHFNSASMTYDSFTNDSGFPGLFVFNPNPGIITAAGFSVDAGVNLPDNAVLFTLHFNSISESTALEWFDDGTSCEYAGPPPNYEVLNDIPQDLYYIDGFINELSPPTITQQPASPDTIIAGSGIGSFMVIANGNDLVYQWQEYITSWSDINNGDIYQGASTENLEIINPPLSMDGYKYRCIVTGQCEPEAISNGLATLTVVESTGFDSFEKDSYLNKKLKLTAFPNPFINNITLEYFLPHSGQVIIEIIDTYGRNVSKLSDQYEDVGNHIRKFNTEHLPTGSYFAKIQFKANSKRIAGMVKVICIE